MSRRQCFEIPGVDHGSAPIPMGVRVGPAFQSSGIMGKDPSTNELPEDGTKQVEFVFANTRTLLDLAKVDLDQVTFVDVWLADNGLRGEVNKYWLEWFPDEHDRPARHTTVKELPGGMLVQLRVQAHAED